MNKSKIYMIISICVLCISIVGSTFAYYREELFSSNVNTITYGLDYYINYAKGQDIESATLLPTSSYSEGVNSEIELWKKDNTYFIYGHIYLDINELGANLSTLSALKYTLVRDGTPIAQGTIKGNTGDSILVKSDIPLETTKQQYIIYVWLDENSDLNTSVQSEEISLTVRCEASMKPLNSVVSIITNLYNTAQKTVVTNNSINYNYAASVNLMNDRLGGKTESLDGGNIRYYGANPNNYVYFNCDDYYNQTADTCELWRIIGIVDGKVKIIREDSLGNWVWDYDEESEDTENTSSDWGTASLNDLLNNSYYNNLDNVKYYGGNNSSSTVKTITLNFATSGTGIKNDETRDMISKSNWYLGGYSTAQKVYSSQMYKYERGTLTSSSVKNTSWNGNIAVAYPSDYGYAGDFNYCTNVLYAYDATECSKNDWLYNGKAFWLLTSRSDQLNHVWSVYNDGLVMYWDRVFYSRQVHPTLYLNQYVIISDGNGTKTKPYQLVQYQKS